jgi:hypothetical protein
MTPEIKVEFERLWREAEAVALSHDEFLELIFNAAVKLNSGEWKAP